MKYSRNRSFINLCLLATQFLIFHSQAPGAVVAQIGQNFKASTFGVDSLSVPPDANGAVGPSHFVELINGRFTVFNKSNGTRVRNYTDMQFWTNAGVTFTANLDATHPRVVFDSYSQRWFASAVDFDAINLSSNRFLLAVSANNDPTGTWNGFAFSVDPVNGNWADFPTFGVDTNGVYLSGDLFNSSVNNIGTTLVSIPKSGLLANPPVISGLKRFGTLSYGSRGHVLQPAVTTGAATTGESVLAVGDLGLDFQTHSTLRVSTINNAAMPNGATLTTAVALTVPPYSVPINPPQPDGTDTLDDGDARISGFVRRVGDLLYGVHAVQVNDRAAVRWYKINAINNSLVQSGTISHTNLHFFYPSIAANENGIVVIGFNGCSSNTFISSYAVVGEVVNGTVSFGDLILLRSGSASYQKVDPDTGTSRWGDYSATSVDPNDPSRFWTIQTYPSSQTAWSTQVTELIIKPLVLSTTINGTNIVVSWPSAATKSHLQTSPSLSPSPSWSTITQMPTVANGQASVTIPTSGAGGFFRLSNQ